MEGQMQDVRWKCNKWKLEDGSMEHGSMEAWSMEAFSHFAVDLNVLTGTFELVVLVLCVPVYYVMYLYCTSYLVLVSLVLQ